MLTAPQAMVVLAFESLYKVKLSMVNRRRYLRILPCLLLVACAEEAPPPPSDAQMAFQKQLQEQLIRAQPGETITIPAGMHPINRGLSLNVFRCNAAWRGYG